MGIEQILANPYVANIPGQVAAGQQFNQQQQLGEADLQLKRAALEKMQQPEQMDPTKRLDLIERQATIASRVMGLMDQAKTEEERAELYQTTVGPRLQQLGVPGLPSQYSEDEFTRLRASTAAMVPATGDFRKAVEEAARLRATGDVEGAQAVMQAAQAKLEEERKIGGMYTFRNPETGDEKTVPAHRRDEINNLVDDGYQQVGLIERQEQGGPGEFNITDKEAEGLRDQQASTNSLLNMTTRIREQLDQGGAEIMGVVGGATRLIEGTAQQMIGLSNTLGGSAEVDGEEASDMALLDRSLYQDVLGKLSGKAGQSAALQANLVALAYAKARAENPDGRLSDADVKNQLKIIASAGSPTQLRAVLDEIDQAAVKSFNARANIVDPSKVMEVPQVTQQAGPDFSKMTPDEIAAWAAGE